MLQDNTQLPAWVEQAQADMIWSALSEMRYLFRHTLMRDAAYDMQLQTRLREMHRLAGEAIVRLYAGDLAPHYADLAYHYGKARDTAQEFHYARLAGERAVAQFANQQAIDHFNQALHSATDLAPDATAEQRQMIHATLGELLTTSGQYDQAHKHLQQALALAVERGDYDAQAFACNQLARLYELRGEYPSAFDWIEQGLAALESADRDGGKETTEAAELLLRAGLIHTRQGEYEQALARYQQGLRIATDLERTSTLARAYNLLGHIARLRGHSATAVEHFQRALDLYQQSGDIYGQATSHNQTANAYFGMSQWQAADRHYRQAREILDR
ncbi:MAG: tetratricopeptide repeat protein, partial [Delftia sp.]|nr:tetratricopeptide repeat protein [Delftia sp.]